MYVHVYIYTLYTCVLDCSHRYSRRAGVIQLRRAAGLQGTCDDLRTIGFWADWFGQVRGPNYMNLRISHSGCRDQSKGDTRNHGW